MMKLSRRAQRIPASPIRKLHPLAEAARGRGVDVINLNIGQPDLPTPPEFFEAAGRFGSPVLAYSPSQGIPAFIDGLIYYYSQNGMTVRPEEVMATIGGSEAITMALLCCANPGDHVLTFEPFYTNYYSLAMMAGIQVDVCATSIKDGFRLPSPRTIRKAITPKTRAIIACNPSNPTGAVLTPAEIDGLRRIARSEGLFIIADEVYREFCYDSPFNSFWNCEGLEEHLIIADSLSKRFSACGARLGSLLTRNPGLQQAFLRIGQARLSAGTFDQHAALPLLRLGKDYYDRVVGEYRKRRDTLVEALQTIPGLRCQKPEGAFYLLVDLPVDDSDKFCAWLLSEFSYQGATVMLAPANGFYATPGKGLTEVRIAYIVNTDRLRQGVRVLQMAIEQYPGRRRA